MPIDVRQHEDGYQVRLSDDDVSLRIDVDPEAGEAHIQSDDVDFSTLGSILAAGEPSDADRLGALTSRLDFLLDGVELSGISDNTASLTLSDDGTLVAGGRWADEPCQLYPPNS